MHYYVTDTEQESSSSQKKEYCTVLWKLIETYLKNIEKNKGGLRIPLSIPQIHFYVDSGLTESKIKYFGWTWDDFFFFKYYTEKNNMNNILV